MAERKILKYNFKRPDRISKNQVRSLHFVLDRFARNFSSSVSAYMRAVVEINLENIAQTSYAEFLDTVPDPTCYSGISLKPLDGVAAIEIGPTLVFPMIDRLLGGAGRPMTNPRPMTEIEQSIMQNVLRLLVDNLRESWRPVYAIEFSLTSTETHPHMVQVTSPNEMVIHFQFQARMKETIGKIHFVIPTLGLEPIMHVFDQEEDSHRKIVQDGTLLHLLRHIPVQVSIETPETSFSMESLVSLQVGDTLVLDQQEKWPVMIKVNGKNKLHAKAQMDATRKTFVITRHVRSTREEPMNGHIAE
ncbi:MAG: flagellar motor switch protein FliM [Acidobacteria bacterium]|nr:MAG: flagellar motor switch protein FliM [Acidobacteriota bacterium]